MNTEEPVVQKEETIFEAEREPRAHVIIRKNDCVIFLFLFLTNYHKLDGVQETQIYYLTIL